MKKKFTIWIGIYPNNVLINLKKMILEIIIYKMIVIIVDLEWSTIVINANIVPWEYATHVDIIEWLYI